MAQARTCAVLLLGIPGRSNVLISGDAWPRQGYVMPLSTERKAFTRNWCGGCPPGGAISDGRSYRDS